MQREEDCPLLESIKTIKERPMPDTMEQVQQEAYVEVELRKLSRGAE